VTAVLTGSQALERRMRNLLLSLDNPPLGSVGEVVTWLGAMQSQDLTSGLFSLALRLAATRAEVESALERREALRTWPMRGTIHLVPSRDAAWMLELMGPRALAGSAKRRAFLGLDERDADRAVDVLGAALAGGGRLSRAQCLAALEQAGLSSAGQLGYHMLWYASQRGVTCIAPNVAGEQTFVLLDEWVPDPVRLSRDEALATIAVRYFRSHGPTTRQDFAGWTGLTAADAKRGIAEAGDLLSPVTVDGTEMVEAGDERPEPARDGLDDDMIVLPGFDEYLLGFKNRSLMLDDGDLGAVIPGRNGVFQATVVRAGRVVATWKKAANRSGTLVEVRPVRTMPGRERNRVDAAFDAYRRFTGTAVDLSWVD
jgi:hypothetical protein